MALRDHSVFLNNYAPADEGLYDDEPRSVQKANSYQFTIALYERRKAAAGEAGSS